MMDILNFARDYGTLIVTFGLLIVTGIYANEVRHQSKVMKLQMEHSLLARKYEKLAKEMAYLVGPLYAARDSYTIMRSGGNYPENSRYLSEHCSFWNDIKKNMYLAKPDLLLSLYDYFSAMDVYKKSSVNQYVEHSQEAITAFNIKTDTLIQQIDISYKSLLDEIGEIKKSED